MGDVRVSKVPAIASLIVLALAVLGRWPYGFYEILRFVVCGSAIYLAIYAYQLRKNGWLWVMLAAALVFNPLLPIHLRRGSWQPIDLLTAVIFAIWIATSSARLS